MPNQHAEDNRKLISLRARDSWIAKLDAAAKAARESRMAYIRRAVEERMAREDHTAALQPGYHGE